MPLPKDRRTRTAVALLLCAGIVLTGAVTAGTSGVIDEHERAGERTANSDSEPGPSVAIDCNRSDVTVTAPEGYRYQLTVAVVNLSQSTSDVTRSTVAPISGNETVNVTESGIAFAFVQNESTDETIATSVARCGDGSELGDGDNGTDEATEPLPAIEIDCNGSRVRFVAPETARYTASVADINVTPTSTSTSRLTKTLRGNATVTLDDAGLVAVYASPGDIGDERTVSAVRTCGFPNESRVFNETRGANRSSPGSDESVDSSE